MYRQNWRRVLVLLVVTLGAWAFALSTGRRLAYQMAYVLTGLGGGALFLAWSNIRWVSLRRVTPSLRAQVGHVVEEHLSLVNRGWLPKLWTEVRDFSTLPGHRVSQVVPGLRPGQTYRWHVRTVALVRGVFRLGPMLMVSSDPFGLFTFRRALPRQAYIIVYPYTVTLPHFPLPEGRLPGGSAAHRRTPHLTTNVAGVRDYQPGDALNRIHWRTTARVGHLMSKEFELDPLADVWLVLDMHKDVYVGEPWSPAHLDALAPLLTFRRGKPPLPPHGAEYAIAAAASLGQYILRRQRTLGLIAHAWERHFLHPDRGERQVHKLLELLAMVQPDGYIPLDQVLLAELPLFGRHTTLIVVTGDWTGRWVLPLAEIRRRGVRPLVVLVDGSTFGNVAEPTAAVEHLARQGIPTYILRKDVPLVDALTTPVVY